MQGLMTQAHGAVEAAKAEAAALEAEVAWRSVVDKAFGRGGIQSFALEGLLQELQVLLTSPLRRKGPCFDQHLTCSGNSKPAMAHKCFSALGSWLCATAP